MPGRRFGGPVPHNPRPNRGSAVRQSIKTKVLVQVFLPFLFMDRTIESLASYASDERIISLVAKERGKAAAKCRKSARRLHDEGIFSQVYGFQEAR